MRALALLAAALALSACREQPVLITGDASAAGARVLIDGREVGRLERQEDGERVFSSARVRAPKGEHRFEVVSPAGKSASGTIAVRGDVYLRVELDAGRLLP